MKIKIVSVNIEGDKHLDTVDTLLVQENPDIVLLMEATEQGMKQLAGSTYPYTAFAPNDVVGNIAGMHGDEKVGVAILSKYTLLGSETYYCEERIEDYLVEKPDATHAPVLLLASVATADDVWQVGAVHFSWTPDGAPNARQRKHAELLIKHLQTKGELLVGGDFNIPRGSELYHKLATSLRDNVPLEAQTTIDPDLHRVNMDNRGKLALVVDYAWSTKEYSVGDLRVVSGVSDHCALVYYVSHA